MNREKLLAAVFERDARFDGVFVYGVASTRIFCRPSCPSKRPKAQNIALFDSVKQAEDAGFRACKRCQPEKWQAQLRAVTSAMRGETKADEKIGAGEITSILGISKRQIGRMQQISQLKAELQKGKTVTEAQNEAGFGSARGVYEAAHQHLGMTPATYGKGGAGAQIRFALAACALGQILVARTATGICAVRLGDDATEMEQQLREEFFAATIARDESGLQGEIEAVLALLEGQEPSFALPLDVAATAWQWHVWQELRAIPRGETRTYGQLATQMGRPTAARAVARACATNPLALVHPCHRVVGADGKMRGYRWNIERKSRLLKHESKPG